MARIGQMYPQVEPGAAALIDLGVAAAPARASAARALDLCHRLRVGALDLGGGRLAREVDLARVVHWDLGALPAASVCWTGLPTVDGRASEIDVRRHLLAGAAMVAVRDGRRIVGIVERERADLPRAIGSAAARLDHGKSRADEATLWLLRVAGEVGAALGTPAYAVGGFVRDLLLDRVAPDVDIAVEGNGIAFARRLAAETGGKVSVHAGFGTASIDGASAAGAGLPRVDVASARTERYERPGALPIVRAAALEDDAARRDFTINAMAIALAPSSFGELIDPRGGRRDLGRRLLRPLHPLSFVEDPTRIFRLARYAARLGFGLAPEARAAIALALRAGRYPALSGQRLRAEIELIAAERAGARALERLAAWNALTLWAPGLRVREGLAGRLRAVPRLLALERNDETRLDAADAALVALLAGQPPRLAEAALDRLAITGMPRRALTEALGARGLARQLGAAARASAVAGLLDQRPSAVLLGAWLAGGRRARRRIEWYLREGRATRPALSGDALIALGVPRGPAVGAGLAMLRRQRLDGEVNNAGQERRSVRRWLGERGVDSIAARKEA